MIVRQLAGGVHRHLLKGDAAGAVDIEEFCLRDSLVLGLVCMAAGSLIAGVALGLTVEHPEGYIDALYLLDVVFRSEAPGQEKLPLVVLLERIDGSLPAQLEGDDEVRTQGPGELPRHDCRIPAVGAGRGRRALVADELRAAAGAAIRPHGAALVAPVVV